MTETPRPPGPLTPARLAELGWKHGLSHVEARDLFQHIDALTAEVADFDNENTQLGQSLQENHRTIDALTAEVAELKHKLDVAWMNVGGFLKQAEIARFQALQEALGIAKRNGASASIADLELLLRDAPLSKEPT